MKYGFFCKGVGLVDMLLALAIAGCLLVFAVPAYNTHINESKRNAVQKELLTYTMQQESFRLTHLRYATAKELTIPKHTDYYIELINGTEQTYQIVAALKNKPQASVPCGSFSVNHLLQVTPKSCW
ncbi:MAG: hypothetical protein Alis3KO_10400 [Aliiglaciecola sp.]